MWLTRVVPSGLNGLEVPPALRPVWNRGRESWKLVAEALREREAFFLWEGQRSVDDDRLILRRVAVELLRATAADEAERKALATVREKISTLLDTTPGTRWNVTRKRNESPKSVRDYVVALEKDPRFATLIDLARRQLRAEHRESVRRGLQLTKEIDEGKRQSLDRKLSDLVRNARERGDLDALGTSRTTRGRRLPGRR